MELVFFLKKKIHYASIFYFSTNFMLTDTTFLAGTTENDGQPTGWKLFRIPLINFKKVQNIEWNEIRYVRIALTDITQQQKTLQIAKMEIVGNEWQEMGIISPDTSASRYFSNQFNFRNSSDEDPQFQVAVINTEDNADYALQMMIEKALDKEGARLFQDGDKASLRREIEASILEQICVNTFPINRKPSIHNRP